MHATHDSVDAAVRYLREHGYDVSRPEDRGAPDALATHGAGAGRFGGRVAVERLADADPTTVVERVAGARRAGRHCLFAAGSRVAAGAWTVLADPPLVRRVTADGSREFYLGFDRVRLAGSGFAACRRAAPDFRWEEVPVSDDESRLALYDGAAVLATLDSVAALACPASRQFPYSYRRASDKRLHVTDAADDLVATFTSFRAMRRAGFQPVPAPLVPEHVLGDDVSVRDDWTIAVVGEGVERVLTADGDAVSR